MGRTKSCTVVFSNDPCSFLHVSVLQYLPYLPTTVAALRVARLTALSGQHEPYLMGGTAVVARRRLRGRPAPRGLHVCDVPSTTRNERDTRQECGHGLAAHHHLRLLGAGPPYLLQLYICSADGCVARMESQAARAYMHEIECVERLALNSLMRGMLY